jgi:Fe-S cluster assembly protein SufD
MKLSDLKTKTSEELSRELGLNPNNKALEKFMTMGLPSKKSEAYRYFDVEKLLDNEYETLDYVPRPIEVGEQIEIVDGVVTTAPQGMRIYYEACEQIDSDHFDPLYYLGHALYTRTIKIEVDGDAELKMLHRFTKSNALINYRIVLFNQRNRHSTLYESFDAEGIENTLVMYGYDMHIAQDSSFRVFKVQTMQEQNYSMIASHKINVAKQATTMYKSFDLGGDQALQLLKIDLDERAHIDAQHLLYLNADSKRGTVSQIIHKGEHSTSNQEAKNILDGDARGIFDALIKVEQTAKHTKAYQNSKAILLHEKAYMIAKPQLEIYIDELEAAHGSTTGQLDPKQLFYLQSRGVSAVEARKMLVIAFANAMMETIRDSRHQELIRAEFDKVFYANVKELS